MTVETFLANFGHLADAPNGVQKLRELILQLAVQGKLVPQDLNDEPALVLLESVKAEKERLAKEGTIKKQKPLPEIGQAEEPFALPNGWQFVRLGEIANRIGSGSTPRGGKNAYVRSGIPFLRSQNIWNHGLELQDVAYITPETHQKMSNTVVLPNDILLNITGASLGRCTVYPDGLGDANVSQHVTIIRPTDERTKSYLHLCILSPYTQALVWGRQVGMAREGLSKKVLELFEIPLPPLEEQKRIVAKVDQLMALCDELEARQQKQQQGRVRLNNAALDALLTAREPDEFANHWQRISANFDLLYDHPETIAKLRAVILQLAVQGKLVPQDPNDEPASVLLERIKAEKGRLINVGKIKKSHQFEPISVQEIAFERPDGWCWSRLGELYEIQRGSSPRPKGDPRYFSAQKTPYHWIKISDMTAFTVSNYLTDTVEYLTKEGTKFSRYVDTDDIVIAVSGSVGKCCMLNISGYIYDGLMVVKNISDPDIRNYLFLVFLNLERSLLESAVGSAWKNINTDLANNLVVGLPPLSEQKRILAKVDQLMALCDELEAKLNQAQQHSEKLMEATVRQLLGTSPSQKQHTTLAPKAPAASKPNRPMRLAHQPAQANSEPLAAEATPTYAGSTPDAILAAMQPGQEYSRATILATTGIREADWIWAIKQLKEHGRVVQVGEKRGARYRLN